MERLQHHLLELAESQGARVINRPRALRDNNEKFSITRFVQFTVPTLVTRLESEIRAFLGAHGDIVLKPLDGMGGASVFRLGRQDPNIGVVIETLTHYGRRTVMAQRSTRRQTHLDRRQARALCPGAQRQPGREPWRSAGGGRGVAQALSPRDREMAEAIWPVLAAEGMLLAGLDVIGDYLAEIHVASPAGMREIMDQTGFNVAGMMIDAIERGMNSEMVKGEG
jgi:glutathione synthase